MILQRATAHHSEFWRTEAPHYAMYLIGDACVQDRLHKFEVRERKVK
jgi:hypothetical protein